MKGLKTNGLNEIKAFRRRLIRQRAASRISDEDYKYLHELLRRITNRVESMDEVPEGVHTTVEEMRRSALRDEF